jgi:hypothetical protein
MCHQEAQNLGSRSLTAALSYQLLLFYFRVPSGNATFSAVCFS